MITAPVALKDRAHYLAKTANDKEIYVDLMLMPLAASIGRNPHLLSLVEEVAVHSEFVAATIEVEYDMGRTIGYCERVETDDTDVVFYARQTQAAGFTRFVKNRQTKPSPIVTIKLCCDDDGDYELINVSIGKAFPPFPGEAGETKHSQTYWAKHAVVFNGQSIVANSLTKDWPYEPKSLTTKDTAA